MPKRYVFNDTDAPKFIGGVLIPPHDGREVDELYLSPVEGQPEPVLPVDGEGQGQTDLDANLQAILVGNVKSVTALLSDVSDETLDGLDRLESASETPRKSLLSAISEEKLKRAQLKTGAPE